MQTTQALSVGTSTNISLAADTMGRNFGKLASGSPSIPFNQLRALAHSRDPQLADAARFFLASALARHLGSGGNAPGLTLAGLNRLKRLNIDSKLEQRFLVRAPEHGRESDRWTRAMLSDPGLPDTIRRELLRPFSDEALLMMFGRPLVLGNDRDQQDINKTFVYLVRLSWLGATEAAAVTHYRVPYKVARGAADHSVSFWDGKQVIVSEKMLGGSGASLNASVLGNHIGTIAHESGHAIFESSGLKKRFDADMKGAGATPGMNGVINEAFAGVFQNRAHVASGHFDLAKVHEANLRMIDDVNKSIASVNAFYAKRYHVDVNRAKAQLPMTERIVSSDIIPYLQNAMHLIDDPQLAQGL